MLTALLKGFCVKKVTAGGHPRPHKYCTADLS